MKIKTVGVALLIFTTAVAASAKAASADQNEASAAYHVVTREAPTLSEVSKYLYGKARWWKKIARWNNLQAPYFLTLNQRLVLKIKPTLSAAQGREVLVSMWRRLNNEFTAKRLEVLVGNSSVASLENSPAVETEKTSTRKVVSSKPMRTYKPSARSIASIPKPKRISETPRREIAAIRSDRNSEVTALKLPDPDSENEVVAELSDEEDEQSAPISQVETAGVNDSRVHTTVKDKARSFYAQGEAHFKRGEFYEAHIKFQKSRKFDPSHVSAWIRDIESLRKMGRGFDAIAVAEALERTHPTAKKLEQYKKAMN